ncbi:hypothetical protein QLQ12_20450 [Actinoplanes sp. NEAU-A12]|uniref:Uncharacterized protein n=1 Tax=Actinoplanes sandaracinus TaxID=3045177 RepID=A0ABT6WMM3_9ACTN|nr:hypothetical protein [Actinoplanes sandaracinus]MDI6100987.1 hypothetical protein [Actinoplanes sandaracinus]
MLTAESTGFWRNRYTLSEDGTPVTTWDPSRWSSGGSFELGGRTYTVKSNGWGTRYTMLDDRGAVAAEAERVGRKNWRVLAGGRAYEFRRRSTWSSDQHLVDGERPIGLIKRTSTWNGNLTADLPGLPLPVQVFVLGVQITLFNAAASGGA